MRIVMAEYGFLFCHLNSSGNLSLAYFIDLYGNQQEIKKSLRPPLIFKKNGHEAGSTLFSVCL
jgi:hypothetical protein